MLWLMQQYVVCRMMTLSDRRPFCNVRMCPLQVFSLIIWFMQQYVVYCGCILAMTCLSILANAFGEWQNLQALSALAR